MNHRTRYFAGLAGTVLALAMAATAFGYRGQVLGTINVAAPRGTLTCGVPLTVSATLLATDGTPYSSERVHWEFTSTPSRLDKVNTTPTTTNARGVATTTVTLACVAGNRTLTASSGQMSAGAVLGVTAAGLPRTSTLPDGSPIGTLPIATILALFAVLAGGGIIVRRVATNPR